MTDPRDNPKTPSVNADHNSNAVGSISAGGDISGNIHIGNVYQTPEDDLPLSSDEIENGLTRFAQYIPERAPVLQDLFSSIAKKLRTTLGADQNSLSPALKSQREDGVNRMKLICMEVMDISFRAICLGQNPPPYDSRPPFLGLFAFHPKDREFFFGREALVQKLVARIKEHPFLAVLGASGSGKSSLVMAGLVPALEAEMNYLTPSSAPLSQLLTAKESASAKTVFVVDQFEELFTHPHDATERTDFIHTLLELTKTNRVVVTMRADFWGEVAIYADLKQAMQEHQELIAPMTVDELHSAMEKQAAVIGLRFDPVLRESILAEVKGEPGAMPLLQHALWELWNRRHGLWIKAEEYQAFGGVKQAIASTAEEVYASCSDFERARVRDIFLRLTRLDESGEGRDTRRRVLIEELIPVNSDSSVTINLLNKLADSRLIVKTDKDVEVAHEALIRHWSRLQIWLNEDRDNLRLRERVGDAARQWDDSGRKDNSLLYKGWRLKQIIAAPVRHTLNPLENAFIAASTLNERRQRIQNIISGLAILALLIILVVLGPGRWAYYQYQRQRVLNESPLVKLEGGEIIFGTDSPDRNEDEPVLEKINVDPFSMEATEVTNAHYRSCVEAGVCEKPKDTEFYDKTKFDKHPVVYVTLDQAKTYCAWLDRRLPDTYEWERAARGQNGRSWPWGEASLAPEKSNVMIFISEKEEWFEPNSTLPVTSFPYGATPGDNAIYDLLGNVWEWTSTTTGDDVYILRGGSWDAVMYRITNISKSIGRQPDQSTGFRCAK